MTDPRPDESPKFVDLAVEWLLQYAGESTVIDADAYPGVGDRRSQVDGYLSATASAIVWFGPPPGDRPDPWAEVSALLSRIEAEFSGRLLIAPGDLDRFDAEPPDHLTWAVAGLRGGATLLRSASDIDRLASVLERGVRAVRLAGLVDRPPPAEEDRALTDSERSAIAAVASACRSAVIVDLAGLGPRAIGEALDAIEVLDAPLVPIVSLLGSTDGTIAGLRLDDAHRLRSLGGVIGLGVGRTFHPDAESLARAIESLAAEPLPGCSGIEGVALGSGFLGINATIEGLGTASDLLDWLVGRFDAETTRRIADGNGRALIERVVRGP